MKKRFLAIGLIGLGLVAVGPALADTPLKRAEIARLITGKSIKVGVGHIAYFGQDGRYAYDGAHPGKYRIADGRICVDFDNGHARCDRVVRDAGKLYLISERGTRFQLSR